MRRSAKHCDREGLTVAHVHGQVPESVPLRRGDEHIAFTAERGLHLVTECGYASDRPGPEAPGRFRREARNGISSEEFVSLATGQLLEYEKSHGPEQVADAAVALWRNERQSLTPDSKRHIALEAELAEHAGWLLFHASRQTEARAALMMSGRLAGLAGDCPFQSFVLDLLAMHAIETGNAGEAITIADELLSRLCVPPRIRIMAHVRKARAYAIIGETSRALSEIGRAKADVLDSTSGRDPSWSWWIDAKQVEWHETEILAQVGLGVRALPRIVEKTQQADNPRQVLTFLVSQFAAHARLKAWGDVANTAYAIEEMLPHVTSALPRTRFRRYLRLVGPDAPEGLRRLSHKVAWRAWPSGPGRAKSEMNSL